jgi:hypothetical protein
MTRVSRALCAGGCLLGLLGGGSPAPAQGVLERMRLATHEDTHAPPRPNHSSSSNPALGVGAGVGAGAAEGTGYLIGAAVVVATSPFWGPHVLLGDDLSRPGYFPACPYGLNWSGYMNIDYNGLHAIEDQEAHFGDADFQKPWAVRLSVEEGNDLRGLNRLDGRFFLDTTTRFGLQSQWNYFSEGQGGRSDETVLGDTELTFRFVQREWLQMHTGLGFRLLTDRSDTRAGFNFVYGADLYPEAPVVISTSLDLGNLDAAFVVHARLTAGVTRRNWELLTGYDFLRIGSVNLQGPLLGLRFWF